MARMALASSSGLQLGSPDLTRSLTRDIRRRYTCVVLTAQQQRLRAGVQAASCFTSSVNSTESIKDGKITKFLPQEPSCNNPSFLHTTLHLILVNKHFHSVLVLTIYNVVYTALPRLHHNHGLADQPLSSCIAANSPNPSFNQALSSHLPSHHQTGDARCSLLRQPCPPTQPPPSPPLCPWTSE